MYDYEKEKKYLFTDEGQRHFLFIRDLVKGFLKTSGAFEINKAMQLGPAGASTTWEMLACIDRLVEIGEIREISKNENIPGRYFIKAKE